MCAEQHAPLGGQSPQAGSFQTSHPGKHRWEGAGHSCQGWDTCTRWISLRHHLEWIPCLPCTPSHPTFITGSEPCCCLAVCPCSLEGVTHSQSDPGSSHTEPPPPHRVLRARPPMISLGDAGSCLCPHTVQHSSGQWTRALPARMQLHLGSRTQDCSDPRVDFTGLVDRVWLHLFAPPHRSMLGCEPLGRCLPFHGLLGIVQRWT